MLQAIFDPHEALRIGRSGWVGYDMYCEYNDMMSARNTRIYSEISQSAMTDVTGQFNHKVDDIIGEERSEDDMSEFCDNQSDMTEVRRAASDNDVEK